MSKPRQTQHFAEIEYCLQNYFNSQLAPVMKEAQTYLKMCIRDSSEGYQRHEIAMEPFDFKKVTASLGINALKPRCV